MCDKCNDKGIIITRAQDDYTRFQTDKDYWLYHSMLAAAKEFNDGKYISIYCNCECCKDKVRDYNKFLHKDTKILIEENIIQGGIF